MTDQDYENAIGSFLRNLLPPGIEQDYRLLVSIDVIGNNLKCRRAGCESGCGLVVTIPTDDLKPDRL